MLSRGPVCVNDALSYENFKTFLLCTQFSTFKNFSRSPFDTTLVFNKKQRRQMQKRNCLYHIQSVTEFSQIRSLNAFSKTNIFCLNIFFDFISICKRQERGLITGNEMNFLKKKVQKAFESLTSDDGPDDSSNSSGEGDEVIIHYLGSGIN